MPKRLPIDDFDYELPEDRIAQHAAEPRESSKLLVYSRQGIRDLRFSDLPGVLPEGTSLFFNNARVIQARLHLQNSHGARIEVFLLRPSGTDPVTALQAQERVTWECLIGNKKKWKEGEVLTALAGATQLELRHTGNQLLEFSWSGGVSFATLLESLGKLPLPPYIRHEADSSDLQRYQTVYSAVSGSVAAPTAGLHFSEPVMQNLSKAGVPLGFLTLHVSAGTFLPVKVSDALEHPMHSELFSVNRQLLETLRQAHLPLAVGTTSCRVLESLYWVALKLHRQEENPFIIAQFEYLNREGLPPGLHPADVLLRYLDEHGLDQISGETSIMIVPSYTFRVVRGLVTNFHQPRSTLLLLISALTGEDWRTIYGHALTHGYRFLSYGDSSLLLP